MSWPALLCVFVLLVMAGEAAVLTGFHRRTGRGPAPRRFLPTLAAGAALVLALLVAVTSAPATLLLPPLAGAFVAHLLDLRSRWPD